MSELSVQAAEDLKCILKLIEDKEYPARRIIYDYVVDLLPYDLRDEAKSIGRIFFKNSDTKGR